MKKPNLATRVLNERILLGGVEMSRAEAYRSMLAEGHTKECVDYFAFHSEALKDNERGVIQAGEITLDKPPGDVI